MCHLPELIRNSNLCVETENVRALRNLNGQVSIAVAGANLGSPTAVLSHVSSWCEILTWIIPE